MGKPVSVTLRVLSQLHQCTLLAAKHPHIGHQSIELTEKFIDEQLNREAWVDVDIVLSALWSVKMLEELEYFKKNNIKLSFEQLVKDAKINIDDFYFWEKSQND